MRAEALEEAKAWLTKAESDLKTIAILMQAEDAPYDSVCFHAQQAAKKILRPF